MAKEKLYKKSKWRAECLFVLALTSYCAVLAYQTPRYSSATRLFPTIILSIFALLLLCKASSLYTARKSISAPEEKVDKSVVPFNGMSNTQAVVFSIIWLVATTIVFYLFGMLPATAVMSFLFWLVYGRRKVHIAALLSIGLTVAVYVIFIMFLNIRNYSGELFY